MVLLSITQCLICKYLRDGVVDGHREHPNVAVKKSSYPHADSVYRSHPTDSKQRSWFVFDAAIVVPEYLVEFEYCFSNETYGGQMLQQTTSQGGVADLLGTNLEDLFPHIDMEPSLPLSTKASPMLHMESPLNDSLTTTLHMDVPISNKLLSKMPNELMSISTDFILRIDNVFDLRLITYLNFHDSSICNIEDLSGLHFLKVLILCFNKISKINGLKDLALLEKLDLSFNLVTTIEGLDGLMSLTSLDLAGNQIWDQNDLKLVQYEVPQLLSLNLRANPIVDNSDYPMVVLKCLSSLLELDNNSISHEKRIEANKTYFSSPTLLFSSPMLEWNNLLPSLLSLPTHQHSFQDQNYYEDGQVKCVGEFQADKYVHVKRPTKELSNTNEYILKQLDDPFRLNPSDMNSSMLFPINISVGFDIHMVDKGDLCLQDVGNGTWYDEVEEVHLERHKLKTMHCFDRLPNLRRLFLCKNSISVIEGLDKCSMLEELLLGDNEIKQIDRIKHVQALWRLDLSHNNLECCGEIGSFQALEQLSIDCNQIKSLKGLDLLMSLMELYAADNLLANLGELSHIKNLPKLIVVDLQGNKLCESNEYRMYTIYTMRKLKVLDGRNVENNELTEARSKYLGRLTHDMLEECMGHCQFSRLKVLDLSAQNLRSCGQVFESMDLRGLTELNLNNNMISSIHSLRFLENLKILQLENNKFEDKSLLEAPIDNTPEASCLLSLFSTLDIDDGQRRSPLITKSKSNDDSLCLLSLESLKLGGNTITSISSLCLFYRFPNLRLLALDDNNITKVDGLEGLKSLEKLYLDHNEIKEVDPFSFTQLQNLRVLCLSNNALKALVHLDGLVALESLDLASNQIAPNRMGGLATIENLSRLSHLLKLSFINNPISRQNLYRVSVISRLQQLLYLDEKEITKEERQEAELYSVGNKEPTPLLLDSNALLDYNHASGSSSSKGAHLKIPLKVTSLNFESICLQQSPRGSYQFTNPSKSRVTIDNHEPNFASVKSWDVDDPKHQSGVLRRCLDRNQPLMRGRGKDENKVIMIPYSTYVKSLSPTKDWAPNVPIQNKSFAL